MIRLPDKFIAESFATSLANLRLSCILPRLKPSRAVAMAWPFVLSDASKLCNAWDQEGDGRSESVLMKLSRASLLAFAWLDGRPLALAWLESLGRDSGECHFFVCRRGQAGAITLAGSHFIRNAHKFCASLYCMIPAPFHGARRLALGLGFHETMRLQGACALKGGIAGGKFVDGICYLRNAGIDDPRDAE